MTSFDDYMTECGSKKFVWGKFDCCIFATNAILISTGIDVMKGLRCYHDETTAAIMLQENFGSTSLRDMFLEMTKRYDPKQVEFAYGKDGDIACVRWPFGSYGRGRVDQRIGFGVFYRQQIFVCVQPAGIMRLPNSHKLIDLWRF